MSSIDQRFGDRFASAPPGHSLTQDNSQWPWGQPPQDVDPDAALEKVIAKIKRPKLKDEMIKLLMIGVSIEVIIEGIIFQGFQEGMFTPDMGMLMKPSLALFIADVAEEENIPYRLFENDNAGQQREMDDETFFRMMKENNPRMFEFVQENINAKIRMGMMPEPPEEDKGFLTEKKGAK